MKHTTHPSRLDAPNYVELSLGGASGVVCAATHVSGFVLGCTGTRVSANQRAAPSLASPNLLVVVRVFAEFLRLLGIHV
jgi:hypothetical protein